MALKMNEDKLAKILVMGEISHSIGHPGSFHVWPDGVPQVLLRGWAGIKLNVRVGDPALGWEGTDHLEPGVTIRNPDHPSNLSLNLHACVGNEAIVASGDAKGEKGTVVAKHSGIEHVILDFAPEVIENLLFGDKIKIKAFGVGLRLLDFPDVKPMNADPGLLKKMKIGTKQGKLTVPVTHLIPAQLIGSGVGVVSAYTGDVDFQLSDPATFEEYGYASLRLGDFVAILDYDHSYGYAYRQGAVTIGIILHGDGTAGHGPGVTTLLTSGEGNIVPVIDPNANFATRLGLRKGEKKSKRR